MPRRGSTPLRGRTYHSPPRANTAAGVDVGATLAKTVLRDRRGRLRTLLAPAHALDELAAQLRAGAPLTIGFTGGGAEALARRLSAGVRVNEFAAWGAGAARLLHEQGAATADRHLIVSVGTGTSVLLADGLAVSRIGGTALGGGTVLGLAAALVGSRCFEEVAELARRGSRRNVDLLVSDIYRAGEIPLAGDLTAANFGRLARAEGGEGPSREDLAHAIMGLVGENVALVCGGLAAAAQVSRVVFGGSTLRGNPALVEVLEGITRALGRTPVFLREGEFAGALGALLLAAS